MLYVYHVITCYIMLYDYRFLVECGARLDSLTVQGGTPLWWARRLDVDPSIVEYLESLGAPELGEDL